MMQATTPGTGTKLGTCTESYQKILQKVSKSSTDLTIRDDGPKEGGNVVKSGTNIHFYSKLYSFLLQRSHEHIYD